MNNIISKVSFVFFSLFCFSFVSAQDIKMVAADVEFMHSLSKNTPVDLYEWHYAIEKRIDELPEWEWREKLLFMKVFNLSQSIYAITDAGPKCGCTGDFHVYLRSEKKWLWIGNVEMELDRFWYRGKANQKPKDFTLIDGILQ